MLWMAFCLGFFAFMMQGVSPLLIPFFVFSPWIAFLLLHQSHRHPLWQLVVASAFTGLLIDLFSEHPFGLHPICYTLSVALACQIRKWFSFEKALSFCLFTVFISFILTHLELFFLFLFDRRVPFTGKWAIGDCLIMPLLDGLFAFFWYWIPLFGISQFYHIWVVFWLKKKNPSLD